MKKILFLSILGVLALIMGSLFGMDGDMAMSAVVAQGALVSSSPDRAAYNRFLSFLKGKGLVPPTADPIINQADLVMEALLANGKNQYTFDPKEGTSGSDREFETKLDTNDIFFVTAAALFIKKEDSAGNNPANHALFTFPDPAVFLGASGGQTEVQSLQTLYAGELEISTANLKRLESFRTHMFRYVPRYKYADGVPSYGPSLEEKGYVRINPNFILDGAESNRITLSLKGGDRSIIAGGVDAGGSAVATRNVAVLALHGFKFSGTTKGGDGYCGI